jgi:isocitrate/isopropylmalate dehydrogenase
MAISTKIPATLIPGDGIGPEIVDAVLTVLDAVDAPFEWDRQLGGLAGVEASGDPLPKATLDSIRRTRLALKGPLTTPVGGGFRSVNVRLREEFGLYANVRPVRTMIPGGRYEDIDIVLIRENIEGLYVRSSILSRSAMILAPWRSRKASIPVPSACALCVMLLSTPSGTVEKRLRSSTRQTC